MVEAARWYLALTLIGASGVLPAVLVFGRLHSGGVLYARPLALLLLALGAWLASAVLRLPYGDGLILGVSAVLWGWTAWLAWRRPELWTAVTSRWRLLLGGEVVFLALFAGYMAARAQAPDAFATEKPMDLMLVTTIRAAERMPPEDPWFADHSVSYYHLGHVMIDIVGRMAGLRASVGFNLGLVSAGAMAGTAIFALAGDMLALTRPQRPASIWVAGAVAVAGLLLVAPVEGLLDLLSANGVARDAVARIGVNGLPGPESTLTGVPTEHWWWWRATRILPQAITEFPAFSILLGDVHAHTLALPLGVLALALALLSFDGRAPLGWRAWIANPGALLVAAAVFAGIVMTNAWDVVLYGLIWFAAIVVAFVGAGWNPWTSALLAVRHMALPTVAAVVLAAPFLSSLGSAARGVALVREDVSDPVRLAVLWVPLVLPVLLAAILLPTRVPRHWLATAVGMCALAVLAWVVAVVADGHAEALRQRGSGWVTLALLVVATGGAGATTLAAYRGGDRVRACWLGLATAGLAVIFATELIYLMDLFGKRTNTVFKFWYVVWLVFAAASGAATAHWFDRVRHWPGLRAAPLLAIAAAVYLGSLLWTPAVAVSRARESQQPSMDALAFLERMDPELANARRWVTTNLSQDDILLEAVGAQYSYSNQLSASTGVPTLLGWAGHELQWRGTIPEINERLQVVQQIYGGGASESTRALAARYGVTYIYLGREEVTQFGPEVMARFVAWPAVFETPTSRIVEVPRSAAEGAR